MQIDLVTPLQGKYTFNEFREISSLSIGNSQDIYFDKSEYIILTIEDFLTIITAAHLNLEDVIINDYNKTIGLHQIIKVILNDNDENEIRQGWNFEKMLKDLYLEWPLMFLEDIANCYKCSLIFLISEIKECKRMS